MDNIKEPGFLTIKKSINELEVKDPYVEAFERKVLSKEDLANKNRVKQTLAEKSKCSNLRKRKNDFDDEVRGISIETAERRVKDLYNIIKPLKHFQDNPALACVSENEIAKRALKIIGTYDVELEAVHRYYVQHDIGNDIFYDIINYKELCQGVCEREGKRNVSDVGLENVTTDILLNNGDEELEELNPSIDNTLSERTMRGVQSIDRWMLKHMHDTGLSSIWGENDKFSFVSQLLKLTARERLYMYYVIEKRCRHNVKNSDVIESQTSYIPDVKLFEKQMKMSVLRVFKMATMGRIYWDKLSDAYGQLDSVRGAIKQYSRIDQNETIIRDNEKVNLIEKLGEKDEFKALSQKKKNELLKILRLRESKINKRNQKLDDFKAALEDYKNKKETADSAWVNKNRKKAAATAAATTANNALHELIIADDEVGKIEGAFRISKNSNPTETIRDKEGNEITDEEYSLTDEMLDSNEKIVTTGGFGFSAIYDPVVEVASDALKNDSSFLGLSETALNKMSFANLMNLSVLSVSCLISACAAISELHKTRRGMMTGDVIAAVGDIISQISVTAESAFTLTTQVLTKAGVLKEAVETVEETAEAVEGAAVETMETIEKVAGVVGIATASIALAANTVSLINTGANYRYLGKAKSGFQNKRAAEQRQRGAAAEGESEEAEKKRLRKERYEDNMLKLQKRMLAKETESTITDMLSNGALLVSALSGGILSPIAGGISVGICIYSTIRQSIAERKLKRKTIDDYLGIADDNGEILENAFANYIIHPRNRNEYRKYCILDENGQLKFKKAKIKILRESIRNEVMARMGCASKSACYNAIMEKYGQILYEGAFVTAGNAGISMADLDSPERKPYVDFIKSLGLKIKITGAGEGLTIIPTKETIVTKLQG